MFRNALAATLRHLGRNKLHTLIGTGGLAIGLCAALIAALVIRREYTYDHFLPQYQYTYIVLTAFNSPGQPPQDSTMSVPTVAGDIAARFPEVVATARVFDDRKRVGYGDRSSVESVYWADPSLFDVLAMPVIAGDGPGALREADGVILSRSFARRFFGRDAPLGEALAIEGHPMTVRAVIEDLPAHGTHVQRDIFASGSAAFSSMNQSQGGFRGPNLEFKITSGLTYVRLRPGASPAVLRDELPKLRKWPEGMQPLYTLQLIPLDRYHVEEGLNPGFRDRMQLLGMLGAVVLLVAGLNFVNLQTARAGRRAREIAVRKLAGASRLVLVVQLLGEALIYAAGAALLALAITEWLLPHVNAFLDTGATLDYLHEPLLVGAVVCAALLFGLLAGAYPALGLSAFRPITVLRGAMLTAAGGARTRNILVALQFAVLIALAICAGVVFRQREYAMGEALRLDKDQVLMVYAPRNPALADEVRKLPGVRAVTRAGIPFLGSTGFGFLRGMSIAATQSRDGAPITINVVGVDLDLFAFYGIKPLAGRLPAAGEATSAGQGHVVLNEAAMRKFGLGTPAEAIEKPLPMGTPGPPGPPGPDGVTPPSPEVKVGAVVPDFTLGSIEQAVPATAYYQANSDLDLLNVRLSGRAIPETLATIDALWLKTSTDPRGERAPLRFFLDEHIQRHYDNVLRQSQAFGICALLAIVLSCIGLYALTAAAAERRTREIALRKALGAETPAVVRLLLWQFTQPVLWSVLIAWPVAAWIMQRWLERFAYHVDLPLWLFPAAALAAVAIAVLTVTTHTLAVARTRPAQALRYA